MSNPASQLENVHLGNGWTVGNIIKRGPQSTGGFFSTGYEVRHEDGRRGFLKATDYMSAFQDPNTADAMQRIAQAVQFERHLCEVCRDKGLSRVMHAIEFGSYIENPLLSHNKVEYLIFDRADCDIRVFISNQAHFDNAMALRVAHSAAAALQQLHSASIAHQDVKPSNILVFEQQRKHKLTDLGCAWAKGTESVRDQFAIPGDLSYAPPELFHDAHDVMTTAERRFGNDLYLLGNLVCFLFSRTTINALLTKHFTGAAGRPDSRRPYADALPYYLDAFPHAISDLGKCMMDGIRDEVTSIVSQLCHPDYKQRGDLSRGTNGRFSLERYVSRFDLMSNRADLLIKTGRACVTP